MLTFASTKNENKLDNNAIIPVFTEIVKGVNCKTMFEVGGYGKVSEKFYEGIRK